jgi:hypothetical protein
LKKVQPAPTKTQTKSTSKSPPQRDSGASSSEKSIAPKRTPKRGLNSDDVSGQSSSKKAKIIQFLDQPSDEELAQIKSDFIRAQHNVDMRRLAWKRAPNGTLEKKEKRKAVVEAEERLKQLRALKRKHNIRNVSAKLKATSELVAKHNRVTRPLGMAENLMDPVLLTNVGPIPESSFWHWTHGCVSEHLWMVALGRIRGNKFARGYFEVN